MEIKNTVSKYAIAFWRISRIKVIVRDFFLVLVVLGLVGSGLKLSFSLIFPAFASLLILLYTFIINDCEDAEDDAKDAKKVNRNPISAKFITYNEGLWIARITAAATVIISLFIASWQGVLVVASGLILGHFYSSKTLRFKALPLIDIISHGYFLAGVHMLIYYVIPGAIITTGSWFIFAGAYLFSSGGDLYNEYRDYDVDRATNLNNTSKYVGKRWTWIIARIYYVVGIGLVILGVLEKIHIITF
jgi:4-hydroxybenzoate polyprenyltransferase